MTRLPLAPLGAVALALTVVAACGERQEKAAEQTAESAVASTEQAAEDVAAAAAPEAVATAATPTTAAEFVPLAAKIILFEVDSSKLAEEKAQTSQVRTLAKNVAADFTRLKGELSTAAQKAGLQAPAALDGEWAARLSELRAQTPEAVGQKYLDQQEEVNEDALAAFQAYAERGDNPDLKAMAAAALPRLRARLAEVKALDEADADEPAKAAAAN